MTPSLSSQNTAKDLTKMPEKLLNRDTYIFFLRQMGNLSKIGTGLAAMLAATNANAEEASKLETSSSAQAVVATETVTRAECLAMEIKNDKIACLVKLREQNQAEIAARSERIADKENENADKQAELDQVNATGEGLSTLKDITLAELERDDS